LEGGNPLCHMMIVQHFENQEEEALYDKRVLYLAEEK
jgi:hypothetical protein